MSLTPNDRTYYQAVGSFDGWSLHFGPEQPTEAQAVWDLERMPHREAVYVYPEGVLGCLPLADSVREWLAGNVVTDG